MHINTHAHAHEYTCINGNQPFFTIVILFYQAFHTEKVAVEGLVTKGVPFHKKCLLFCLFVLRVDNKVMQAYPCGGVRVMS